MKQSLPQHDWQNSASAGAQEKGLTLVREGSAILLRGARGSRTDGIVRSSTGTGGPIYRVSVRYPRGISEGAHGVCTCADKRKGFCKHVCALLESARKLSEDESGGTKRPSWLASAYMPASSAKSFAETLAEQSEETKKWIVDLDQLENWLEKQSVDHLRDLLTESVSANEQCGSVISQIFGGSDASTSSYQGMVATRFFDTLRLVQEAKEGDLRWVIFYLCQDLQNPWILKRISSVLEKDETVQKSSGMEPKKKKKKT